MSAGKCSHNVGKLHEPNTHYVSANSTSCFMSIKSGSGKL